MAINYRCSCGQQIVAEDSDAGTRMLCPVCGAEATVPHPSGDEETARIAVPINQRDAATARTQGQIALGCGILAFVLLAALFVTLMVIGSNQPVQGPMESFRHGFQKGAMSGADFLALFLAAASFLLSIAAVVFGALGRRKLNVHNRGVATSGMVLGIVSLSIYCCCCCFILVVAVAALGTLKQ
jgi:hypothetical protein